MPFIKCHTSTGDWREAVGWMYADGNDRSENVGHRRIPITDKKNNARKINYRKLM